MWTALARFEAAARRPWFGHAAWLAICVGVLLLSLLLTPSVEVVSFFGFDVPTLCTFRRLTGINCPGCGLTRSFVFLGHGQLMQAFQLNPLGPPLYALLLTQIPWKLYRLYQLR